MKQNEGVSLTRCIYYFFICSVHMFAGERIEWETLRIFLRLAKKAARSDSYREADAVSEGSSRETIELFFRFLTSNAGLFLKEPLVHELAEAIDGKGC